MVFICNYRKSFNHIKDESLITKLEEKYNLEIEDFKVANNTNLGKAIVRNVKFSSEDLIEEINGKLYIEPMLFLSQNKNPFKLENRQFPVDFTTPWKDKNTISLTIPKGYKVESIPAPLAIGLPENLGVFKFKVVHQGGKISTLTSVQFNQSMISPQHYAALKDFYSQLVKKQSEKIVLIKE